MSSFPFTLSHRVGVYPAVSAEHVAKGLSAKLWVDHVVARAGRGKGECFLFNFSLCDWVERAY